LQIIILANPFNQSNSNPFVQQEEWKNTFNQQHHQQVTPIQQQLQPQLLGQQLLQQQQPQQLGQQLQQQPLEQLIIAQQQQSPWAPQQTVSPPQTTQG